MADYIPRERLLGRRVEVVKTSRQSLNGQRGEVISFDHQKTRYVIKLDDGCEISLKPANIEALPDDKASDGDGEGDGGEEGEGGGDGAGLFGRVKASVARLYRFPSAQIEAAIEAVAAPVRAQLNNHPLLAPVLPRLRPLLPEGADPASYLVTRGGAASAGLLAMVLVLGLARGLMAAALVGGLAAVGGPAYSNAGGGFAGLKAAGRAAGTETAAQITKATGRPVSPGQAQAFTAVLVGLGLRYALFPPVAGGTPTAYVPDGDTLAGGGGGYRVGEPYISHEYRAGWEDHQNSLAFGASMPAFQPPLAADLPRPGPGGGGGGAGGFSLFTLMPALYLGKNVLDLGGGWERWSSGAAFANARMLPGPQKLIMGFMALRVAGLSPF